MKRLAVALLLLAVVPSVILLSAQPGVPTQTSHASGPVIVGFDMDPSGNSCPGDGTDCTLGSIEMCVELPSGGGPVEFDVYLDDLPPGEGLLSFQYHMGEEYDRPLGPITAYTHTSAAVNLLAQPGSSILDLGDPTGTVVPSFDAAVSDLGASEYSPPYTHGTLGRYTLDTTGVPDGLYGMTLDSVTLGNDVGGDLCVLYGCQIEDAYEGYGMLAINTDCPGLDADAKVLEVAAEVKLETESKVQDPNTKFHVVLACVDDEPDVPRRDCDDIASAFFGDEVDAVVIDGQEGHPAATQENIKAAVDALKEGEGKAKKGEEFVFFLESHCTNDVPDGDTDPEAEGDQHHPSNTHPGDEGSDGTHSDWAVTDQNHVDGTADPSKAEKDGRISDDELRDMLSGFPDSVTITVMIEACYADNFVGGTSDLLDIRTDKDKKLGPGHLEVLLSSAKDQRSWGYMLGEKYKGFFGDAIYDCMGSPVVNGSEHTIADIAGNDDGVTTSAELHECVKKKVAEAAEAIGEVQTPQYHDNHKAVAKGKQAAYDVSDVLHNNGPSPEVGVLGIKTIDCPHPSDGGPLAQAPTQCSWEFDEDVVEVAAVGGVQYYFDMEINGRCDPPNVAWFNGSDLGLASGEGGRISLADLVAAFPPPIGGPTIDPGDCIIADSAPEVFGEVGIVKAFELPASTDVTDLSQSGLICPGEGDHVFTIIDEVIISNGDGEDPEPSNNVREIQLPVVCLGGPVGGTVEVYTHADAASISSSSGSGRDYTIPIGVAVAAVVVALTAGAWYARRRWLA